MLDKVTERENYLRTLMAQDPKQPTDILHARVAKKYGRGVSQTKIIKMRETEFGLKFGPRGTLVQVSKVEVPKPPTPVTQPSDNPILPKVAVKVESRPSTPVIPQADLTDVLSGIQKIMRDRHIESLQLTQEGEVKIAYKLKD